MLSAILLSGCNYDEVQDESSSVCETSFIPSQTDISISKNTVSPEEITSYKTSLDTSTCNTETVVLTQDEQRISSAINYTDTSTYSSLNIETQESVTDVEETSISCANTEVPETSAVQFNNVEADEGGIH